MRKKKLMRSFLAMLAVFSIISISNNVKTYADKKEIILYEVKSGDCLSILAEKYNSNISEIKFKNNLVNNYINVGRVLEIPVTK